MTKMTSTWAAVFLCTVCSSVAACKKEATASPDANITAQPESQPIVQVPDPEEIGRAQQMYLAGDYAGVHGLLDPLLPTLTQPEQVRAASLCAALLTIAIAEELPENATDSLNIALAHSRNIEDPEVGQMAHLAQAAHHIGSSEFALAQTELEAALAIPGSRLDLANLLLGRAQLNQAFDEQDRVAHPEQLDLASKTYKELITSDANALIKGRAEMGMAAIANYQRKAEDVCTHALAAREMLKSGGAHTFLLEVPTQLLSGSACPSKTATNG